MLHAPTYISQVHSEPGTVISSVSFRLSVSFSQQCWYPFLGRPIEQPKAQGYYRFTFPVAKIDSIAPGSPDMLTGLQWWLLTDLPSSNSIGVIDLGGASLLGEVASQMASSFASSTSTSLFALSPPFSSFPACFVGFFFDAIAWIRRSFLNWCRDDKFCQRMSKVMRFELKD